MILQDWRDQNATAMPIMMQAIAPTIAMITKIAEHDRAADMTSSSAMGTSSYSSGAMGSSWSVMRSGPASAQDPASI